MTKTKQTLYKILTHVPFTITLFVVLFVMPDTVPIHFDINGNVDRYASKYELFILPVIILIIGSIFLIMAKHLDKKEKYGSNNFNISTTVGIVILTIFNVLTYYFLYVSFMGIKRIESISIDFFSLITVLFGVAFIVIGNLMPKIKMNSLMGLRTKWSMSSEEAWQKSQKFAGIVSIITGVALIIAGLLTKGNTCIIILLASVIVMVIVDSIYSYIASTK